MTIPLRLLLLLLLAVAGIPERALAAITEPTEVEVTSGEPLYGAYRRDAAEKILIQIDETPSSYASVCGFYSADGSTPLGVNNTIQSVTGGALSGFHGEYTLHTLDPLGTWTIKCVTATSPTEVRIVVVADAHQRLWIDTGEITALADEYDVYAPSLTLFELNSPPAVDSGTAPQWVRQAAWWYLLQVNLPNSWDGGTACTGFQGLPKYNGAAVSCGTTAVEKPDLLLDGTGATGDAPPWAAGVHIEQMGLAYMVGKDYRTRALGADPIGGFDDDYLVAGKAWTQVLLDDDWNARCYSPTAPIDPCTAPLLDDIDRARLLVSLAASYDRFFPDLTPAERRDWAGKLAEKAHDFWVYGDNELIPTDTLHYQTLQAAGQWNRARKVLRNDHTWERNAAIGIVAMVLQDEMCSTCTMGAQPTWDAWHTATSTAFTDILDELGTDGADIQGVFYYETSLGMLLKYLEAARTIDNESWSSDPWLQSTGRFLRHMTRPDGSRVEFGDAYPEDGEGPSWQLAAIASQIPSGPQRDIAQRLAWYGHNAQTESTYTVRDEMDIVSWDATVAPLSDASAPDLHDNECFPDAGIGSMRPAGARTMRTLPCSWGSRSPGTTTPTAAASCSISVAARWSPRTGTTSRRSERRCIRRS